MSRTRRFVIAGNWKMNTLAAEAAAIATDVVAGVRHYDPKKVEVVLCPPFVHLSPIANMVRSTAVGVGAQNCHEEPKGAYTGEVAAPMLADVGCSHVIIGHSERRILFAETNSTIYKKLKTVLQHGMLPILCVGETLAEREAGTTFPVVQKQIVEALDGILPDAADRIIIAYEPVWAIGTGRAATAEQAQEVHALLRSLLVERYGEHAGRIPLLYGGSMNADNAEQLLTQPDVDGGLIGGASLKAASFLQIASTAMSIASR